nr:unnamed protein product [Callosobruchus analis]
MALQNPSLGAILPVVTANIMLLFHTVAGQICLDGSLEIFTAAYFTRWHLFDKENKKLLLILMVNTMNGLQFKKGGASLDLLSFVIVRQIYFSTLHGNNHDYKYVQIQNHTFCAYASTCCCCCCRKPTTLHAFYFSRRDSVVIASEGLSIFR